MPRITKTKEQEKALARTSELLKRLNKINQVMKAAPESERSERNRESAEISVMVAGVKVKIPVTVETALDILSDTRKRYCAEVRNSEKKFNIELDDQDHCILVGVSKTGKSKRGAQEDVTIESPEESAVTEQNTSDSASGSGSQDFTETNWKESENGEQEFVRENLDDTGGYGTNTWHREE